MVPVSEQLLFTFIYGAKDESPKFLGNFNPRFLSAGTGTDRHLVKNSYILIHNIVANCVRFMSPWLSY